MREKLNANSTDAVDYGIAPACAGKTMLIPILFQRVWDHPRVCGKNTIRELQKEAAEGSPPRVREKLQRQMNAGEIRRITPACAGKTYIQNLTKGLTRDHPRVCGKNPNSI